MLIEAAKGGHTNVVNLLLDYPNSIISPTPDLQQLANTESTANTTEVRSLFAKNIWWAAFLAKMRSQRAFFLGRAKITSWERNQLS